MRSFQHLDPIALKAFYYAAETLNFTKAAAHAGLTQSGVSQHIAQLEQRLGTDLFLRHGRKVQLTQTGVQLKTFAENYLDSVEGLFEKVREETQILQGPVRYAMPASCLMTPHFPMLLDKRQEFGEVELQVQLCHSRVVSELLQNGEIDFGFVTQEVKHRDLQLKAFGQEEYALVADQASALKISKLKELKAMPFITYPGMEELFEIWLRTYFSGHKGHSFSDLKVRGQINSLNGAITMVEKGLGLGIFPRHCVQACLTQKKLFAYQTGPIRSHIHPIYMVTLKKQTPTARVQKIIDLFWEMKAAN